MYKYCGITHIYVVMVGYEFGQTNYLINEDDTQFTHSLYSV